MLKTITRNDDNHTWVWPRKPAQWLISILSALLVSSLIFAGTANAQRPAAYSHEYATHVSREVVQQTAQFIHGSPTSLTLVKLSANHRAWVAVGVIRTAHKTMRVYIHVDRATGRFTERTATTVHGVATLTA